MADKTDTLTMELDKRLEDLFDEETLVGAEASPPPAPQTNKKDVSRKSQDLRFNEGSRPGGENLGGLNALLLSMEWEIDDSVMDQYLNEIRRLQDVWEKDRIVLNFFRTLEALGSYLKQKKVRAHQDTLRILQEIQSALGTLMDMGDSFSESQRRAHFQKSYASFQEFRKQITGKPDGASSSAGKAGGDLANLVRGIVREELERFRQRLLQELRL